jgi:hypothetical protein
VGIPVLVAALYFGYKFLNPSTPTGHAKARITGNTKKTPITAHV